jgi:DNA polymerase-1
MFENEDVEVAGFGGDTMHMARLWDSSRTGKGYSLEALTNDKDVMRGAFDDDGADRIQKIGMKKKFGKPNVKKDGSDGKLVCARTAHAFSAHACPPAERAARCRGVAD